VGKIYEALERSRGQAAELVLPLLTRHRLPGPETAGGSTLEEPDRLNQGSPTCPQARLAGPDARIRAASVRIAPGSPLLLFDGLYPQVAEQYRIIRTRIVQHPRQPRLLAISSPQPGDGKTSTAINIGVALSRKRDTTALVVDADLRQPSLDRVLGLPACSGLAEVLAGACRLDQALRRVDSWPSLYLLPAGARPDNPTELLDSNQWRVLCEEFRRQFQFVVLDAPPVGWVADYDLIQEVSDGVVLVITPHRTSRRLCLRALDGVPEGKLTGAVMNCVPKRPWWKPARYQPDYCCPEESGPLAP